MDNPKNDRWALLASDLGIEIEGEKKNEKQNEKQNNNGLDSNCEIKKEIAIDTSVANESVAKTDSTVLQKTDSVLEKPANMSNTAGGNTDKLSPNQITANNIAVNHSAPPKTIPTPIPTPTPIPNPTKTPTPATTPTPTHIAHNRPAFGAGILDEPDTPDTPDTPKIPDAAKIINQIANSPVSKERVNLPTTLIAAPITAQINVTVNLPTNQSADLPTNQSPQPNKSTPITQKDIAQTSQFENKDKLEQTNKLIQNMPTDSSKKSFLERLPFNFFGSKNKEAAKSSTPENDPATQNNSPPNQNQQINTNNETAVDPWRQIVSQVNKISNGNATATDQVKPDQTRTDRQHTRTEPPRTSYGRTDLNRTDLNRTDINRTNQTRPEQTGTPHKKNDTTTNTTANPTTTTNPRYNKPNPNYRYNNSDKNRNTIPVANTQKTTDPNTANRTPANNTNEINKDKTPKYNGLPNRGFIDSSNINPERLFDDVAADPEEVIALMKLIDDGSLQEDEEQRRLASLLGEPSPESSSPPLPPPSQTQTAGRVNRYPQQTNPSNLNTKNFSAGNFAAGNKIDNRYTPRTNNLPNNTPKNLQSNTRNTTPNNTAQNTPNNQPNNQTGNIKDRSTVVIRGRRGSRFTGYDKRNTQENTNSAQTDNIDPANKNTTQNYNTNTPSWNVDQNARDIDNTQQRAKALSNDTPAVVANPNQKWRGKRFADKQFDRQTEHQTADRQYNRPANDNTKYDNSTRYNNNLNNQTNLNQNTGYNNIHDADYFDDIDDEGVVTEEERMSFAQVHRSIPSWSDAVNPIVDSNITRHNRYQNDPRRGKK
ncbi:MAG: hypothetical protein LBQ66_09490 [Planctomycetaceae bacterium]|jgi:hypothetical protein|nr:hypothetical protein [Planctomycetaceae bacterium]